MRPYHKTALHVTAVIGISVLLSYVVLNRWAITDIGVLSYGRVWQFYISYEDFGFVRRALIGTFFSVTGVNYVFDNEYFFAIFVHHIAIFLFAIIVLLYIIQTRIDSIFLVVTVGLSPAFIIQSGYTTGSLDIFVLNIAAINILYPGRLIRFSLLIVFGVFTHEVFIFTIPAQLVAYFRALRGRGEPIFGTSNLVPLASVLASIAIIAFFGATDSSQDFVEGIMEQKIPNAARQHGLWSGYFEISKSAAENRLVSIEFLTESIRDYFVYMSIPLAYVMIVTARLVCFSKYKLEKVALVVSASFPLLAAFVGTDLYRWIGLSANVGLLLTLAIIAKIESPRTKLTYLLLPFSLLAPFGSSQIDWPFPAHQFILERLFQ